MNIEVNEEIKRTEEEMYNAPNQRFIQNPEELGRVLKKLRGERGLKQSEIAKKLGFDRSTYSYYEIGRITPSIFVLIKLSEIFKVELATLFFVDVVEYQEKKTGWEIKKWFKNHQDST